MFFKSPKSQHKPQCLTVPPFPLALCPERCASSCGSANQSEELQLAFFYRLKQENQAAGAQGCSPVASVKTCVHTMDTYQGSPCSPPPPQRSGQFQDQLCANESQSVWVAGGPEYKTLDSQMFLVEMHQCPRAMATVGPPPPYRMSYLLALRPNLSLLGRQGTPLVDGMAGRVSAAITK